MTTLRMGFHGTTGRRIVEIVDDRGNTVGTICPTDDGSNAVHIISKHFDGEPVRPAVTSPLHALIMAQHGVDSFLVKFREVPPHRHV